MLKKLLLIASLAIATAYAEPPVIWNGIFAKSIASGGFQHKSNRVIRDCGSTVPSAGAGIAASEGSLCQYDAGATGSLYIKTGAADTAWTDALTSATGWGITGNAGLTAGTNFLGTTDAVDLVLKANNTEYLRITSGGSLDTTLGAGIVHSDVSGILTSSAVDLATSQVTGVLPNANTTGTAASTPSTLVLRDSNADFAADVVTVTNLNAGGAIGNGATVGAVNVKGTDSLGSQLQLEGPNSANANRFLYFTQRENGDFFMYNPGLNRVIFDYAYATNATSIGQSSGTYQFNVIAPDSGTSLGTVLQGTGLGLTNTDATNGNFSVLGFQGTASGRSPDSAIYGVHDLHAGASSSGSMEFHTRNAGTLARAVKIALNKIVTMDAYGAGVCHFDASGVISSSTIATGDIANNAVTNAKSAQMAAHTIKGNNTASTADPDDLTLSEVAAELDGYFVDGVGTIDSQAKAANGAAMTAGGSLILQNADLSFPGLASTGTQDFAGVKRFAATPLMKDGIEIEDPGAGTNSISLDAPTLASTFSVVLPATKCNPNEVWKKSSSGDGYECAAMSGGGGSSGSYIFATHGTDCSWGQAPGAIQDFSDDASCTYSTVASSGFSSISSQGSNKPGIVFTAPATGIVKTCVSGDVYNSGTSNVVQLQLYDGTNAATTEGYGSGAYLPFNLCVVTSATASSSYTVRLQGWAPSTGTITINGGGYGKLTWTTEYL